MPSSTVVRWILLRLLRSPAASFASLALLLGVPLLHSLMPTTRTGLDLALAWAFPAALLGIGMALWTLSEGADFLSRLDPWTRGVGEWSALSAAGLYLLTPILAGALLSGATPSELGRALPAILTVDVFLGSLALLALVPKLASALRTCLFLAVAWALPALTSGDGLLAPLFAWLDVHSSLRAVTPASSLRTLSAAAAIALVAHLLRTAPARAASR